MAALAALVSLVVAASAGKAASLASYSSRSLSLSVPPDLLLHDGQFFVHPSLLAEEPTQVLSLASGKSVGVVVQLGSLRAFALSQPQSSGSFTATPDASAAPHVGLAYQLGFVRTGISLRSRFGEEREYDVRVRDGSVLSYRQWVREFFETERNVEVLAGLGLGRHRSRLEITGLVKRVDRQLSHAEWQVTRTDFEFWGFELDSDRVWQGEVSVLGQVALSPRTELLGSARWSNETVTWSGQLGFQSGEIGGVLPVEQRIYGSAWRASLGFSSGVVPSRLPLERWLLFVGFESSRAPDARGRSSLQLRRVKAENVRVGASLWADFWFDAKLLAGVQAGYELRRYDDLEVDLRGLELADGTLGQERFYESFSVGIERDWRNLTLTGSVRTKLPALRPIGSIDVSIHL